MKKSIKRLDFPGTQAERVQFGCLLLLGLMDLFLMFAAPLHPWLFEYLVESYLVVPALIFLGAALNSNLTRSAKHDLLLAIVTVLWMALAQAAQRKALEGPLNINTWWAVYLLAFPFASVARDGASKKGLKLMAGIAVIASMFAVLCSLLMILDILPPIFREVVIWDDEARLVTFMHPNMVGWLLMIGIACTLAFFESSAKKRSQGLLLGAAAVQLVMLALTNSRTTVLMTAAFVAGVIFFHIFKKGWKQFLLGLLAAAVVAGSLFVLSDSIYDNHVERMVQQRAEQIAAAEAAKASAAEQAATVPAAEESVAEQTTTVPTGEKTVAEQAITVPAAEEQTAKDTSEQPQPKQAVDIPEAIGKRRGFWEDFVTFNGRTGIWNAGLESMKMHPEYFVRGTWLVGGAVKEGGNPFEVLHSHNAWVEMLIGFGIPGLVLALYFTFLAVRGICCILLAQQSSMLQKCVALLVLSMLGAGVLEPFLFTAYQYCHFFCVMFMLCVGYLNQWREQLKHPEMV